MPVVCADGGIVWKGKDIVALPLPHKSEVISWLVGTWSAGDIGDVEELPEGTQAVMNPNMYRIRPRGQDLPSTPNRGSSSKENEAVLATFGEHESFSTSAVFTDVMLALRHPHACSTSRL